MKVLKCGKMFDSAKGVVVENVYIFVNGNKVEKVCNVAECGCDMQGYEIVDLSDKFVTPGLIDCHVHLSMNGEGDTSYTSYKTVGDFTIKSMLTAQDDLMAGFTYLRCVGDMGFVDVSVRNAINRGEIMGPRLMVSGPCLGTTGSHADSHYNPYITESIGMGNIADGADSLAAAARYNIKHGVDMIKFMSTGGVMSLGTTVGAQQMHQKEMESIVNTANMYGMITATHAHGTNGIKCAVKAGVTSVEHAMMLDDECIEEMVKRGTYMVPTIIAAERIVTNGHKIGTPDWAIAKANQVLNSHKEGFKKAKNAGVKIAFGTDAATPFNFHGKQGYEFELLLQFGMSPLEALTAATKTASELIRKNHEVGSIEVGKYADIVAFEADPTQDIKAMQKCCFVMKDGVVYKG